MGTGNSGRYYTSNGSRVIHHAALIHSLEGDYVNDQKTGNSFRLKSGGHGQEAIDYMQARNIEYNIEKILDNGVRVGNVPNHKVKKKRTGCCQSWFPMSWTQIKVIRAAEYVVKLKKNENKADGDIMWGKYKGVWVGVIKTYGKIATVFPDSEQSDDVRRF